jgi:hypothetical protein
VLWLISCIIIYLFRFIRLQQQIEAVSKRAHVKQLKMAYWSKAGCPSWVVVLTGALNFILARLEERAARKAGAAMPPASCSSGGTAPVLMETVTTTPLESGEIWGEAVAE